ncbi:MAG TPA: hypothetical protein VGE64_01745 [Xanthomonadaceae bacterium]
MAGTVLVHVALTALLRQDRPAGIDAIARDDALQVTWIERPPADVPPVADPPRGTAPARTASTRRSPLPREVETAVTETTASGRETASLLIAGDDVWSESPGRSPRTRDIDPSAFRRDPLSRRDTTFEPAPARMEAAIRDRSFGGWMQRTTKARICGDLAAQLRRAPESTDAVIASMRRHGCRG